MWFRSSLCFIYYIIALGVTLCAFGQSPSPPSTPTPAAVPAQMAAAPASPVSLADLPSPLNLKVAMDLVAKRNLAILAARYDIDAARAARLLASLRPNPVVTLGMEQINPSIAPRYLRGVSTDSLASNTTYTMRVDQIFERGNKRQLRTQVADFNVQAAEAQLLDVLRQALFNLKQAFYTSVLARENLKVAQENLDYFTETEKLVNESFKAGAVAEVDLIRIRTQRVQYQRDYTDALKNYQQSARDLLNILGVEDIPLGALIVPTVAKQPPGAGATRQVVFEARGNLKIRPQLFRQSELRQDALENRPDVMNARKLLSANTSALMLARALRRRDVDVGFEYQRVGAEGTAGIVVQFPLFIFNNQKGAIDQAMAAMKASQMRLKQAELQALTDVDKAFSNYAVSEQLLRSYNDEFIKQAEEARNIEEYSYRAGQKSLIEFLDAQRAYNQARVALNQARFDYRTSLYQIEQATGKSMLDEDVITEFD